MSFSCPTNDWREAFYAKHIGENPDAKKKAFQRCRKDLVDGRIATVLDDQYSLLDGSTSTWVDAEVYIQRLKQRGHQAVPNRSGG